MRAAAAALALALAACAQAPAPLPGAPIAHGPGITIVAEPVAELPGRKGFLTFCADIACGQWTYAGGLNLTSPDTSRLHGLSDLEVTSAGALTAITDNGDLVRATLVLGAGGHLPGLADGRLTPLAGLDGQPLGGDKSRADAEGLATFANGDRLVSFERDHRIWLYPANGAQPRPAPAPAVAFPLNEGLEALAVDAARGADAYVAGAEASGQTWHCRLSSRCEPGPVIDKPVQAGLTAMARLSGGRTAWLLRSYDAVLGARIELRITDAALQRIGSLRIERPATVDNFEGVAAVPRGDGTIRFYLLSDDNFSASQRTLQLSFDWKAPR